MVLKSYNPLFVSVTRTFKTDIKRYSLHLKLCKCFILVVFTFVAICLWYVFKI